ncbi:MAG: SIMPL domain-containing protein [Pseudomonadales bacterium]|nr:SIMPL domain-containing protein [Pseudomonadales bacterium]
MITRVLLCLSLIMLLVSVFMPMNSHADGLDQAHLNLFSEAEIQVKPDFIQINIQIEQTEIDASIAKKHVDQEVQQILALQQRFQIKDTHIEASDISITPSYRWLNNERQLIGQRVKRDINIKLYQLQRYGDFVNEITQLKIARYQSRGFGFDDLSQWQTQALVKALNKADTKAQILAKNMHRKLGEIFQVTEMNQSQHFPMARSLNLAASSESNAPAPLEIKPQLIKAKVNVIYLLK